jgi:hypothetical protein
LKHLNGATFESRAVFAFVRSAIGIHCHLPLADANAISLACG